VEHEVRALQGTDDRVPGEPVGVGPVEVVHVAGRADRHDPATDGGEPARQLVVQRDVDPGAQQEPPADPHHVVEPSPPAPVVHPALDEGAAGRRRRGDRATVCPRRDHGGVALGGGVGVGDADDLAQLDGEVDDGLDRRHPLGAVGVEQRPRGEAGEHQIELPGQVGRVPEAGAQALTGERRHLVRGVAGEQHRPAPPLLHPPGLEGVDGVALEGGVVGTDVPWRKQLPGGGLVVEEAAVLAGQAHELPPAPARAAGHHGGGSGRVADLEVDRVEHPIPVVEDHVDDQPVEEVAEVPHRRVDEAAHGAVGAVAPDHGPSRRQLGAVDREHRHRAVVALVEVADLHAATDLDTRQPGRPLGQQSLEGGLVEHR
jgi:hypothetical protein